MRTTSFQTTIENQFDYICKRAIEDERKDYLKYLSRISKQEVSFSNAGEHLVNQFSTIDYYDIDMHMFSLYGSSIGIKNELLSEALKSLSDKKRIIILLYYFMDMNDTEISKLLNLSRSTIYRHRTTGLAIIKEFMKEHTE